MAALTDPGISAVLFLSSQQRNVRVTSSDRNTSAVPPVGKEADCKCLSLSLHIYVYCLVWIVIKL